MSMLLAEIIDQGKRLWDAPGEVAARRLNDWQQARLAQLTKEGQITDQARAIVNERYNAPDFNRAQWAHSQPINNDYQADSALRGMDQDRFFANEEAIRRELFREAFDQLWTQAEAEAALAPDRFRFAGRLVKHPVVMLGTGAGGTLILNREKPEANLPVYLQQTELYQE
jgi:hypothetical protein